MSNIDKIRQEIERLKAKYRKDMYKSSHEGLASGYKIEAYNELLTFLDTLSEEPSCPNISDDLKKEVDYYIENVRYFPDDGREIVLELAQHFADRQKEDIMKEAVEGRIGAAGLHNLIFTNEPEWVESLDRLNKGDKVRIIVLKAEEE